MGWTGKRKRKKEGGGGADVSEGRDDGTGEGVCVILEFALFHSWRGGCAFVLFVFRMASSYRHRHAQ